MLNARFPKPGEVFAEKYQIEKVLNRGGFAQVMRAKQTDLGRTVAIKVLRPVNLNNDSKDRDKRLEVIVRRFELEAQTVSQLHDARTIRVFDYGSTPNGLLFMVMEFVPGEDISVIVRDGGKIEPGRVVHIADQVLCSLEEAHSLSLIHRDVKPANIMVYDNVHEKDCVKLLDFGLVKSMESDPLFTNEDPALTGDDNIVGTPRYMAPEQVRGEQLDGRTDLYSLGLVMYEMLTGTRAIEADTAMKVLAVSLSDEPIQLSAEMAPPVLRRIVNTLLQKSPEMRPMSATAVREMLQRWNEVEDFEPVASPISETIFAPRNRNKRILVVSIFLMFLVAMFTAVLMSDETNVATPTITAVNAAEDPAVQDDLVFKIDPLDDSVEMAKSDLRDAIPDPRMIEFALSMNDEPSKTETKKRKPRKKRKPKKVKQLKVRTLDE